MSYYYLIASLPSLSMEQAPISEEEFQSRCEAELTVRDLEVLRELEKVLLAEPGITHTFNTAWSNHEIQLRNTIARIRAAKRQSDADRVLRPHGGFSALIDDAIEHAWAQPTPLAREKALDALRWQMLDDLQGPDPFSFRVILAYAVKRRLAQRWASMDAEAGWTSAAETFEQQPAGRDRQNEPETAGGKTGTQT